MDNNFNITQNDAEILLQVSRKTLEKYIRSGEKINFDHPLTDGLKQTAGMFVTLHKKERLRGCIGYIIGQEPIWKEVLELTVSSAVKDPRFPPVTPLELDEIEIEISILTPPEKISDVEEIKMGQHGVIVKRGSRQGVFLPQVAQETLWNRDTFLSELCSQKAGLPPNAWKDKDTELFIFSAIIFNESNKTLK